MSIGVEKTLHPGFRISHYEIVEKIGEGGMGAVFLAKDLHLRRSVAIKVLRDDLEYNKNRLNRFEQEAVAASALNHPNILTIHEIGESEGVRFIVSEYVKGATLRERIRDLTVSQAIDIAVQAASSLEAAHEHGIVHRDIKPENIMLRDDGLVKVLDFGLAKLAERSAEPVDAEEKTLALFKTEPGTIMGTPSYMSPEQARGHDVDRRTDVWSLGTVLFEMLAGYPPFGGGTSMDVIASILNDEPRPLPSGAAASGLAEIVSKSLEKNVDDRYRTSGEMLAELRSLKRRHDAQSISGETTISFASAQPDGKRSSPIAEPATEILKAPVTNDSRQRRPVPAMLKLAFAFLGIALAAGVGLYAMYFRGAAPTQTQAAGSNNSPAYDLYMRGKVKVESENREDIDASISLFEQAVAIDPNYADAYAALARAYSIKAFYFAPDEAKKQLTEDAEIAVNKALLLKPDLAEGHFARGLILWTHARRFPHEQAIQSYKRAIVSDPNFDEAHHQLGLVYLHIGLFDEGREEIQKALTINPANTLARFRLGVVDLYRGEYEEALEIFNSTPLEKNPSLWASQTATVLFQLGRNEEASALIETYLKEYPNDQGGMGTSVKAMLLAKAGKEREAEAVIQRAVEIGQGFGHFHHTAYNIASAYALLNKPEDAIKWLKAAAEDGFPCYPLFENDANLNSLRKNAHFIEFMAKLKTQMEKYKALA